eukprot:5517843-Prymnesium_polylepis.2
MRVVGLCPHFSLWRPRPCDVIVGDVVALFCERSAVFAAVTWGCADVVTGWGWRRCVCAEGILARH